MSADTTVTVTINGESYRIDAAWLRGFCRGQGELPALTPEEGARFWREKQRIERTTQNREGRR